MGRWGEEDVAVEVIMRYVFRRRSGGQARYCIGGPSAGSFGVIDQVFEWFRTLGLCHGEVAVYEWAS